MEPETETVPPQRRRRALDGFTGKVNWWPVLIPFAILVTWGAITLAVAYLRSRAA